MAFIEQNSWMGYKSLSGFVAVATRKLLNESRREVYEKMMLDSASGRSEPPPANGEVHLRPRR